MRIASIILVILCHASAWAQSAIPSEHIFQNSALYSKLQKDDRNAIQQQGFEFVVPELIIGGEWTSTLKITNRSTKAIPARNVYFIDNLGNPMTASFQTSNLLANGITVAGPIVTGAAFSFSLGPGGILEATFIGGPEAAFGHAIIDICPTSSTCSSAGMYAEIALRNHNSTRPDFESIFPLEQPASVQYMLWDSRNGITNVLYLVSDNTTSTTVSLDFLNPGNQLIRTVNITLPALGSQILPFEGLAPEIVGQQGTLAIHGTNSAGDFPAITATALRVSPSNSFTPVRAFVPSP